MEWICVKDQLPEKSGVVLIFFDDYIRTSSFSFGDFYDMDVYSIRRYPTHWMQLPPPPNGK